MSLTIPYLHSGKAFAFFKVHFSTIHTLLHPALWL